MIKIMNRIEDPSKFYLNYSNHYYKENDVGITIHKECFLTLNYKLINMGTSNFWYYFIMAVVILHFVVGFGYLIYKLSPRKSDKKKNELPDDNENED